MYFLEKTDCSNSNPPFMTYFEDPDPASFVYTIEELSFKPLEILL